jgi:DNA repair exonuclease SbcCD ATPase subunit
MATWERESAAATAKVAELEAMGLGKAPAICAECGQPLERDNLLEQLAKARKRAKALAAAKPAEPMRFSQDAAAIIRLETRQRELGFEPALLAAAHRELTAVTAIAALRRLVAAFGVTGIPARIIEGVLPELGAYANELLGRAPPGRVARAPGPAREEGRQGRRRGARPDRPRRRRRAAPGALLGGERMSVSLALAVGLSRLVARRAGTAIRTLVIDEPDGLDADARRAFGQALRVLAHQGELERVVLVSHHPDLAESPTRSTRSRRTAAGSATPDRTGCTGSRS